MSKRLVFPLALLCAAVIVSPTSATAASAPSPWWQVQTRSVPTNQWVPQDFEEEITTENGESGPFVGVLAAILVHNEVVGCLATAGEIGSFCEGFIGFPPTSTAAELEALLEGVYGTSAVEVSGGPVGGEPFEIVRPGGNLPALTLGQSFLGSGTWKVRNEGGSGHLVTTVTNLGDAPLDATQTPLTIVDELPEGVEATTFVVRAGRELTNSFDDPENEVSCSQEGGGLLICSLEGTLQPYEAIELDMWTSLTGQPPAAGAPGKVTVSGGNAPPATAAQSVKVSPEEAPFGFEYFTAEVEAEGGGPDAQAGDHPFQFTTSLAMNTGRIRPPRTGHDVGHGLSYAEQPAMPRNLRFPLPAGLIGNATARPQCSMAEFLAGTGGHCSPETALGVAAVTFYEPGFLLLSRREVPVFNLPPAHGEPARFGFVVERAIIVIDTAVDPDSDYRIVAETRNLTQIAQFLASTLTLWGSPGDPRHDGSRGNECLLDLGGSPDCERPAGLSETPFLRLPVSCSAPLEFGAEAEPWSVPIGSVIDSKSFSGEALRGCNRIPFDPTIAAAPSSKLAEAPSGLNFKLTMPNSGLLSGEAISEGQPKRVEVTLPQGMTLNPSAAEGLATCSPSDYARERFDSTPGEGCPDSSKLGSVLIDTPLIKEQIKGSLYLAAPHDNPFDSLLALYIVARVRERGVLVKLPLKVETDKQTGQIVTILDDSPQQPVNSFELNFREGGRAPLVTPPACGNYDIVAKFVPWSAQDPDNPAPSEVVTRKSAFTVQHGVDGGACPPGGVPPFHPEFQAGSVNNDAASHTPFDMRLIRHDGEQDMTKFSTVLPPGVLGKLAGVAKCPSSAIAEAKAKSATEELASPSCPANSQVGRSLAGAGAGSVLTYVGGKIYLGGPYHGDPLSIIAITPAKAGPFDVGTVVVQEALTLNPKTAEVEVDGANSDPIPHILEGIPLKLRDLRVYVDRPDFILNPTSCEKEKARATLFGSYLNVLDPSDDRPVDLSARYQAANCQNLGLKPDLALKLKGGTRRGAHPGLKATYRPRKGDANLKGLTVRLPSSAFLDQGHIRTICTRVQFAAKNCPKGAQYGYIKATTPLLDEPLEGPVYLRSSNHKLPDLVFDLHGLVDVEVATRIDSVHGGIRATVEDAPDAPLTKVVLTMQGAKKGLIVNSRNLCGGTNRANADFTGHNGKEFSAKPVLRPDCGGKRKSKKQRGRG
jgi:hypothetical protein